MTRRVIRLSQSREAFTMQDAIDVEADARAAVERVRRNREARRSAPSPTPYRPQTTAERDTDELFGNCSAELIAALAGVDITTARRWRRGRPMPSGMVKLLRLLIHGDLSAIAPAWRGWTLRGDNLHGPDGLSFKGGEILASRFLRDLTVALQIELAATRAQLREARQIDWIDNRYVTPRQYLEPERCTDKQAHDEQRQRDSASERQLAYLQARRRRENAG